VSAYIIIIKDALKKTGRKELSTLLPPLNSKQHSMEREAAHLEKTEGVKSRSETWNLS
jgi:hypothetical protein